ncbi:MAG TPA: CYTH and CHAD domain-containing protein [Nitrospiraceae bacterium]|nr:CYTH and CHAD domain-containing protein [Nitrospiraceae bacterium]
MAKSGASPLPGSVRKDDSAKASVEREIKLSAESTVHLPASLGRPLPIRRLTSKYYDTEDLRLARAGITLRRRTEERRGVWQLKLPVAGARRELELPGPSTAPPSSLQDLLMAHLREKPLREIATLRTHRQGIRATNGHGGVADVVVDHVSVTDGRHIVRRFREIEIELVKGDQNFIAELEKVLRKAGAGNHDGRPKLFHALDLPMLSRPGPPAKDAPLREHLRYSLGRQLHALLAHDPGTRWGRDPEHLHQMRVATRRLRAILRAAAPLLTPTWVQPLREDLVWLGALLGPVRDLDVQLDSFRREAKRLDVHDRGPLIRFVKRLLAERQRKQDDLVDGLRSKRYLGFIERLIEAADAPSIIETELTLKDIAAQEFKKLAKAVDRLDAVPSDVELHRVRIKAKRARYAAELAESAVGKRATKFIRSAKALQDVLGKHQDAVVGEQRIRTLFAEAKGRRAAFTAGRMVERQRQRRDQARALFWPLWKKVEKRARKVWQ